MQRDDQRSPRNGLLVNQQGREHEPPMHLLAIADECRRGGFHLHRRCRLQQSKSTTLEKADQREVAQWPVGGVRTRARPTP